MAFDPDKYLAEKAASGQFNPDAYIQEKSGGEVPSADPYSKLGSAGMGALNQLGFGLTPELVGASEHPIGAVKALMGLLGKDSSNEEDVQNYAKVRDEAQSKFNQAKKDNPGNYMAGSLAGGILPAILTGGVSAEGQAAKSLSGMLGGAIGTKTAANALTGAGYGALSGLGSSQADLTKGQGGQLLKDVAENAAIGAPVGGIVGKIAGSLSPESLEEGAAKRAVSAMGGTKGQAKALANAPAAEEGGNRLIEQGQNLLSKNEYTPQPIVTPFAGHEAMLERANDLAEKSGKHIGDLLGELDSQYAADPDIRSKFVNPSDIADKVEELQSQFMKNGEVVPLYKGEYYKLQDALDTINKFGNTPIDFAEANQLKQLISKSAYNDKGQLEDQLMGQVRGIVNDSIEDAADKVSSASGNQDLSNSYMNAKEYYRTAKDAQNMLQGRVAGKISNRDLGVSDYMAGLGGAALHGTPTGIAAVAANKLGRTYGNNIAASGLKTGASVSRAINSAFTQAPEAIGAIGKSLTSSQIPVERSLGRILVEASEKDDIGRNALIFSLMQNPTYRDMMAGIVSKKESP